MKKKQKPRIKHSELYNLFKSYFNIVNKKPYYRQSVDHELIFNEFISSLVIENDKKHYDLIKSFVIAIVLNDIKEEFICEKIRFKIDGIRRNYFIESYFDGKSILYYSIDKFLLMMGISEQDIRLRLEKCLFKINT